MSCASKNGTQESKCTRITCRSVAVLLLLLLTVSGYAQVDPGIRPVAPGDPDPLPGLTTNERGFFFDPGLQQFRQVEAVADGLGPRFNLDSCAGCHVFPKVGGSSPPPSIGNPQFLRASTMAPGNVVPPFITVGGPVREVRFIRKTNGNSDRGSHSSETDDDDKPKGAPDGGVHDIFTIAGRSDSPAGCKISQPDFSDTSNLIFRIPTPVFGCGLIESITDTTIKNNLAADSTRKHSLGITGHVNTTGNDGTVTRFGWKAQNKSLLLFAGEAYNVEMGITNEIFQNEREEDPKCATNGLAENHTDFDTGGPADIVAFMAFMRFLDQPKPACGVTGQPPCSSSIDGGRNLFEKIGCALCHTPSLMTGFSPVDPLNQKQANLFSDLAVHHMGGGLADNITQGNAGPDEFRTAPLWGIGQRAFFLHDGRTSDLLKAILAHGSRGSEASQVIDAFQRLSSSQKQDILNFLRSR